LVQLGYVELKDSFGGSLAAHKTDIEVAIEDEGELRPSPSRQRLVSLADFQVKLVKLGGHEFRQIGKQDQWIPLLIGFEA
jgi:hypothetical protein